MNSRNYAFDTLRTVLAVFIVIIHVSAPYFFRLARTGDYGVHFWVLNYIDAICRISVPVFIMISGRFLLGRKEPIKQFYLKRGIRVLIPMVFWTIIYLAYRGIIDYQDRSIFNGMAMIKSVVLGKPFYHLWYLYMLIGLYAVMPVITKLMVGVSRTKLWYIAFAFVTLGFLNEWYSWKFESTPLFVFWFVNYIGYLLLGYLIKEYKIKFKSSTLMILFLWSAACTALVTAASFLWFHEYIFFRNSPFIVLSALTFFLWFSKLNIAKNWFSGLAKLSYGNYLVHALFIDIATRWLKENETLVTMNNTLENITVVVVVLLTSLSITYIFSKTPFLNKTV